MAATEVEANTKTRKSLIGRSRPRRKNYVPGDAVCYWRTSQSISRKDNGWDPQDSLVLKVAICGCHMEQKRSNMSERTSSDGITC